MLKFQSIFEGMPYIPGIFGVSCQTVYIYLRGDEGYTVDAGT